MEKCGHEEKKKKEKKEMAWNDSIAAIEREFCLWLNSMVRLHDGLIKIKINKEKLVGIEYFACECVCLRFVVVYASSQAQHIIIWT